MTTAPLSDAGRALVESHLPLVREVLAGVVARCPRHADREELAQAATLGLVEAAARFDVDRGVPFDRWAALRIRGAVVDALRALDVASRSVRAAARDVAAAMALLEDSLGRPPSLAEVAAHLGLSVAELVTLQGRVHRALVLSLDAPCGDRHGLPVSLGSALVDGAQLQPWEVLEQRERTTYAADALACLPARLREVVEGYFVQAKTSGQLASELGVSASRVSQLRTEALALMRTAIEAQYGDPSPAAPSRGAARRQAALAAELAARSTYASRLSALPLPGREPARRLEVRAAG